MRDLTTFPRVGVLGMWNTERSSFFSRNLFQEPVENLTPDSLHGNSISFTLAVILGKKRIWALGRGEKNSILFFNAQTLLPQSLCFSLFQMFIWSYHWFIWNFYLFAKYSRLLLTGNNRFYYFFLFYILHPFYTQSQTIFLNWQNFLKNSNFSKVSERT